MTYTEAMHDAARRYVRRVMRECRGNVSRAAQAAGLHRTTMYRLFDRYGIQQRHPNRGNTAWRALGS